jgi:hypothetical protein
MDLSTLWVGIATFIAGGLIGAIATVYATRKESGDRRAALALEREKWEHERDKPLRERRREALLAAQTAVNDMGGYLYECHKDPARLDAFVGEFHEARVIAAAVDAARRDLEYHELTKESDALEGALDSFASVMQEFNDTNYHACFDTVRDADHTVQRRLAGIA